MGSDGGGDGDSDIERLYGSMDVASMTGYYVAPLQLPFRACGRGAGDPHRFPPRPPHVQCVTLTLSPPLMPPPTCARIIQEPIFCNGSLTGDEREERDSKSW